MAKRVVVRLTDDLSGAEIPAGKGEERQYAAQRVATVPRGRSPGHRLQSQTGTHQGRS